MPHYLFETPKQCIICGKERHDGRDNDLCRRCSHTVKRRKDILESNPDKRACTECGKIMRSKKDCLDKCVRCLGGATAYYRTLRIIRKMEVDN